MWALPRIVVEDRDRMTFLAGDLHPVEVATWVEVRAEADLGLDRAPHDGADSSRRIDGELVDTWISDRLATTSPGEVLAWVGPGSGSNPTVRMAGSGRGDHWLVPAGEELGFDRDPAGVPDAEPGEDRHQEGQDERGDAGPQGDGAERREGPRPEQQASERRA